MTPPLPLVLDTDIGTDVDDLLALVLAATDPRFDLRAVTTVNGATGDRAAFAARVLRALGRADVLVGAGRAEPLDGRPTWRMPGQALRHHEGAGRGAVFPEAHEVLREALLRAPGKVAVCAIGAYSNVAAVFRREPALLGRVGTLALMGGCRADMVVAGQQVPRAGYHEYNLSGDPLATGIVFGLPVRRVLTTVDATYRLRLSERQLEKLASGTAVETILRTEFRSCTAELLRPAGAGGPARRTGAVVTLDDPAALLALLVPPQRLTRTSLRVARSAGGVCLADADKDPGGGSPCWIPPAPTRGEVIDALHSALSRYPGSRTAPTGDISQEVQV